MIRYLTSSILALLTSTFSAAACTAAPSFEQIQNALAQTIEGADHLFIGEVAYVTRHRWGEEDSPRDYGQALLELSQRRKNGEDIGTLAYLANFVDYSDAAAFLTVEESLIASDLADLDKMTRHHRTVPIDLLYPYTVAGHGPCYNFPTTCPFDLETGETVLVAVEETQVGPWMAVLCKRVDRLTAQQRNDIRESRGQLSKADAFLRIWEN